MTSPSPAAAGGQRLHAGEGLVGELEHRGDAWVALKSATLSASTTINSKVRL